MTVETWQQVRSDALVERVMTAAVAVLDGGRPLTFREVAEQSGVPERTIYRHFPSRPELLAALFAWTNRRVRVTGERPTDLAGARALVRSAFPVFDDVAAVVHELLNSPEGRDVRFADKADRQATALELVGREAPALGRTNTRRVAAIVQLLMTANTWQLLRDYWDMDGTEAAETAALAMTLLLTGASSPSNQCQGDAP